MNTNLSKIYSVTKDLNEKDKALIEKAYHFSEKAHSGQNRKSGEPYFNHVFATAFNLADLGMSPIVICAGFLHDVLQDTPITEDELQKEFGSEITRSEERRVGKECRSRWSP